MANALGDTVYIDRGRYGNIDLVVGTVSKVTPSGQFTVTHKTGEIRFNRNGSEIGGDKWHSAHLVSKERYDELSDTIRERRLERAARDAIAELGKPRAVSSNRTQLLELVEAARTAIEALPA